MTKLGLLNRSTADELFVRSRHKRPSFARLAIAEALLAFGMITGVAAVFSLVSDRRASVVMLITAIGSVLVGALGRRVFVEAPKPPTTRILMGLVVTWITLVLMGAVVYLLTGTIDTIDGALVESAAGFSTTSVTVIDPTNLSTGIQIWRASTQWFGGLFGVLIAVIALPQALRGSSLLGRTPGTEETLLVAKPGAGRRQIIAVYSGFSVVMALAYAVSGLSAVDSVVHSLTTVSTGGFSSNVDSFVNLGGGPRVVAIVGMTIAGSGYFVIWWALRGRIKPLLRSSELRTYIALIIVTTALLVATEPALSIGDALFTTVSALSTTGYAVHDWTLLDDFVLTILLIVVAMGSMAGSAGGGLRILRVNTLMKSVIRELRTQLDPHRVSVIKVSGRPVEETSVDRMSGYVVAHMFLCAAGAFVVSTSGVGLVESLWIAIGTLSSFGPAPGIGAFGDLRALEPWVRVALIPLMIAARLSVLVVLLAFVRMAGIKDSAIAASRRGKRALRR